MGFIRKAFNFVVSPTHTRSVLVLFILVATVPLTVFISQKQQQLKQRASGQSCEANYTPCTNAYNECNQNCYNLNQNQYGTYDEYTQAYYSCADNCSNDESKCNADAYSAYLQCWASAESSSTSSVNPTPEISQEPSSTPTLAPATTVPTSTPIPSPPQTQTPKTLFDCSGVKLGYSYQCFSGSCQSPYTYSGYSNSGTSCDSYNQVCCVNYNVSTPVPSKIPTLIPTAVPTSIPITESTQFTSPTPTVQTPSSVPYCYLKSKGDGNCDNMINLSDFELWRTEFVGMLKGIPIINKPSDFNNDGTINIVDFNIWKTAMADPTLPH